MSNKDHIKIFKNCTLMQHSSATFLNVFEILIYAPYVGCLNQRSRE